MRYRLHPDAPWESLTLGGIRLSKTESVEAGLLGGSHFLAFGKFLIEEFTEEPDVEQDWHEYSKAKLVEILEGRGYEENLLKKMTRAELLAFMDKGGKDA